MPSRAAVTVSGYWSRWTGRACSSSNSTTSAAGGVITTCSPICCGPGWPRTPTGSATAPPRRAWYHQHGLTDDTIHHAVKAGEVTWAARLIEEHFDTVFNLRGEQATIQSWLPTLPDEVVRSRPRLMLAQAQMASMTGDLEVIEPLLDAAEDG